MRVADCRIARSCQSEHCDAGGREGTGSATGGARSKDAGCLHVEEERRRAAPLRELTLALLGDLPAPPRSPCSGPRTAARAAAFRRSPRRTRSSCRSRPARAATSASLTLLSVSDFIWMSANSMSSWMSASELSTASRTSLQLAAPGAFGANVAHLALHFRLQLAPALLEHLSQLGISRPGFSAPPAF